MNPSVILSRTDLLKQRNIGLFSVQFLIGTKNLFLVDGESQSRIETSLQQELVETRVEMEGNQIPSTNEE